MKKNRGFTLVELLIVIAIIAVLSAVGVVGYSSFIKKAKLSDDEVLVTQWNKLLQGQEILDGSKYITSSKARALFIENGSTIDDFTPKTDGYHFYWNRDDNRIYLVDDKTNKSVFPTNNVTDAYGSFNTNYLTFTAQEANSSVTPNFKGGTWEYSTDGTNWVEGKNDGTTKIVLTNIGDRAMLRGNNCVTCNMQEEYIYFEMTGKVAASGSVTSLTDGAGVDPNVELQDYCYLAMFFGCASLTSAPELPAKNLSKACYCYMFYGCTSLMQAPELPATSLKDSCYFAMFSVCTSLVQAPVLPATILVEKCYQDMFTHCTSLVQAPELPATKLADSCYAYMFSYCDSLTTAPKLPATNLEKTCYMNMFEWCVALVQAPELPATVLADSCYYQMFTGCVKLTMVPELVATNLVDYCCGEMFYGCSALNITTVEPMLGTEGIDYGVILRGAKNVGTDSLKSIFENCHKDEAIDSTPILAENVTYYWYK